MKKNEIIDLLNDISFKGLPSVKCGDVLYVIIQSDETNVSFWNFLKSIIKSTFTNQVSVKKGTEKTAFLFSNSYGNRKDHKKNFCALTDSFPKAFVFLPGPKRITFSNSMLIFLPLIWSFQLFGKLPLKLIKKCVQELYLTFIDAHYITGIIKKEKIQKVIVFSDFHPIDSLVVQKCNGDSIRTATLQHGHFGVNSPAFLKSHSNLFLGYGNYSEKKALSSGYDVKKFRKVGMLQTISIKSEDWIVLKKTKAFLIICGGDVEDETELLYITEELVKKGYQRNIKLHPGFPVEKYKYIFGENDHIIEEKSIFELIDSNDFALIAGGSTVYFEYLLKMFPAFVYENKKKRFEGLSCERFNSIESLKIIVDELYHSPQRIEEEMRKTRAEVTETKNVIEKYYAEIQAL